jgi:hypothetical protein
MRPSLRSFVPFLVLLVACSPSSGGPTAKPDAARESGATRADGGTSDTPVSPPDVPVADLAAVMLDAGKADGSAADLLVAKPDVSLIDLAGPQTDGRAADLPSLPLDGGALDAPASWLDGSAVDTGASVPDAGASKDAIIRACVLATSCAGDGSYWTHSDCLHYFGLTASRRNDLLFSHLLACAGAKTCSQFRACWGGDLFTLDTVMFGGSCTGNKLTVVPRDANLVPVQFDCGAVGAVCELLASNSTSYGCNAIPCSGGTRLVEPKCEGMTASSCGGWAEYASIDCARTGRICRIDGMRAVCDGTEGPACEGSESVKCSGSVATYCGGSGRTTFDCARTNFRTRCAAGETSWEPCAPAATECDPINFLGQCDGNKLKVCVDGAIVSVACSDVGLVSCEPASGSHYARCREGV